MDEELAYLRGATSPLDVAVLPKLSTLINLYPRNSRKILVRSKLPLHLVSWHPMMDNFVPSAGSCVGTQDFPLFSDIPYFGVSSGQRGFPIGCVTVSLVTTNTYFTFVFTI